MKQKFNWVPVWQQVLAGLILASFLYVVGRLFSFSFYS